NFVYVIMNGFSQAVISFVGQNVGARNYNRVKKVTIYALISGIVCGIIIGNLVALFGRNITSLFSKTPEVIDASMIKMNIVSRLYFLCSIVEIFVGAQRGMGNSLTPTLISIFAICGTRLIWIFTIFNVAKYHTLGVLFTCYPLSWAICAIGQIIAFVILFKKNKKKCEQGIE
ncbi:MAG: MATE family efflux transporter, partial [Clostridia bacterium]|nr:MATE family efflux transporter [Clostridia bacterium]